MGFVFRGWRRKLGLVTLVMASLFMVGWVRSLTTTDCFRFFYDNIPFRLISHHGIVEFRSEKWLVYDAPSVLVTFPNGQFLLTSIDNKSARMDILDEIPAKQRWQFCGFV